MDEYVKIVRRCLHESATIHIQSFPNFILETCLTFLILMVYILLHLELSKVFKRMLRLKPNTIYCKSETGSISKDSVCTSVTHYRRQIYTVSRAPSTTIAYKRIPTSRSTKSQMGWVLPTRPLDECVTAHAATAEKKQYGEQLIALTPEQFVKIDKERKMREKELDSYMTSLSTLCKNVLRRKYSSKTLNRQVESARESLQCNKMTLEGKYLGLKTDAMTRSLFCMLEQIITNSSLQNPVPFKGDITTLALDVAELSSDGFSKMDKWDANSSGCISTVTDETESISTFKDGSWEKDDTVNVNWQKFAK